MDAKTQGMTGAGVEMACREKTWDEMDDAQRIALLRRELRFYMDRYDDLARVVRDLERHGHDALGRLTVPLAKDYNESTPRGYRRRHALD